VAGGILVLLIPGPQLVRIVLWSQVLNGVVLPFVLIFMLLLINKKELMGEYVNSHLFNAVAWATTIIVAGLSFALAFAYVGGKAGG
jgi:Mn2+/Fe2+ NRAMP family transporter